MTLHSRVKMMLSLSLIYKILVYFSGLDIFFKAIATEHNFHRLLSKLFKNTCVPFFVLLNFSS